MRHREGPLFKRSSGIFTYRGVICRRVFLKNSLLISVFLTALLLVSYATYKGVSGHGAVAMVIAGGLPLFIAASLNGVRRCRDIRGNTEYEELYFAGLILLLCLPIVNLLTLIGLACIPGRAVIDTGISDYYIP